MSRNVFKINKNDSRLNWIKIIYKFYSTNINKANFIQKKNRNNWIFKKKYVAYKNI